MEDSIDNENGELLKSIKRAGRPSPIHDLMNTKSGKEQYSKLLLMLSNRCSLKAAAMTIGIRPDTLTRWLRKGKEEEEGVYRLFYDGCVSAISHAVVDAEIELNQSDPKFYLTRGPGKTIVGDIYNIAAKGELDYGLDGSIAPAGNNPTAINNNEQLNEQQQCAIEEAEKENDIADDLTVEALKAMSDAGIDMSDVIQDKINDA